MKLAWNGALATHVRADQPKGLAEGNSTHPMTQVSGRRQQRHLSQT